MRCLRNVHRGVPNRPHETFFRRAVSKSEAIGDVSLLTLREDGVEDLACVLGIAVGEQLHRAVRYGSSGR